MKNKLKENIYYIIIGCVLLFCFVFIGFCLLTVPKRNKVKFTDDTTTTLDSITSVSSNTTVPDVFTDQIVSETYNIDFYSAKIVNLHSDAITTLPNIESHNPMVTTCVDELNSWLDNENISKDNLVVRSCNQWNKDICNIEVVIDDIAYYSVLAITDDCSDNEAKFYVDKRAAY